MSNLAKKKENAHKALDALKRALARDWKNDAELRDAVIQRFEFSIETSWKYYQALFREQNNILSSPKDIFREAFKAGYINEDETETCLEMIDNRNLTSHTYNEELAVDISSQVPDYVTVLEKLLSY